MSCQCHSARWPWIQSKKANKSRHSNPYQPPCFHAHSSIPPSPRDRRSPSLVVVHALIVMQENLSMKPHHLAQVLLRIVAIFLVWRAVEFGISQYVGFQYQMKIYTPSTDERMVEIFRSVQVMILFSALVPIVLGILWWLSPKLALLIVPGDTSVVESSRLIVPAHGLLQVAAFVFIALAVSNLPQIIFSFSAERTKDPTITVMTSRVFPDALQFIGKIIVGGIILIIVKQDMQQKKPRAEQTGDGDAEQAV